MPARAHQLHQPSRSADRELGSRRQSRGRRALSGPSTHRKARSSMTHSHRRPAPGRRRRPRRAGRPARRPLRPARRPNPAPPPPPPSAPPTGSPPSSRPRTACSPSASAARRVRRPGPHHRRDPRPIVAAGRGRRSGRRPRPRRPGRPANLAAYITGLRRSPTDRAANAVAKTLLARDGRRTSMSSAAYDLEADLRGAHGDRRATTRGGSPTPTRCGFGNFANGIGQALGHPRPRPHRQAASPAAAVDYLLDQQCSDGSFRLLPVRLHAVLRPVRDGRHATPATIRPRATPTRRRSRSWRSSRCRRPPDGAPARSPARSAHLLGQQQPSGGFFGTGRGEQQHHRPGRRRAARGRRGRRRPTPAPRSSPVCRSAACASSAPSRTTRRPSTPASPPTAASGPVPSPQGVLGLGLPDLRRHRHGRAGATPGSTTSAARRAAARRSTPKVHGLGHVGDGRGLGRRSPAWASRPARRSTSPCTPRRSSLGTVTADADGAVAKTVTIPADVEPGDHTDRAGRARPRARAVEVPSRGARRGVDGSRPRCRPPGRASAPLASRRRWRSSSFGGASCVAAGRRRRRGARS